MNVRACTPQNLNASPESEASLARTSRDIDDAEKKARFRIGVFAVVERGGRYLLALRRDIGWWNLPGGGMEYGETVEEALRREVREEVGINVAIERLVGVYSKPQKREVVLTFLCHPTGDGEAGVSDEVTESRWCRPDDLPAHLLPKHRQRLEDALAGRLEAIIRAQTSSTEADQGLERPV
jgi:8-oxo-dGTP pyrophosphatase MutT (NUDIX family)